MFPNRARKEADLVQPSRMLSKYPSFGVLAPPRNWIRVVKRSVAPNNVGTHLPLDMEVIAAGERSRRLHTGVKSDRLITWLLFTALVSAQMAHGQPKRVYIGPDDHTDYFWSADEETYRQAFLDTLDYYLDLADATAGNPSEYQSRWNCDGSFWLWTYEKHRTPAEFQRLIDRIADGHISVPLNALCTCLGGAPLEMVIRGMYYPGQIERKHGLRFRLAYMIENQTQPYGLTSVWAGSGARYSWKGICGCNSLVADAWDREHDIYRAVGPDGSEILMKWNSMLAGNQNMGGYAEARDPAATVDFVTINGPFNTDFRRGVSVR